MSDAQRVEFTVGGIPQQQGSKAPYGNGRLDANHVKLTPWRAEVSSAAVVAMSQKERFEGAVWVGLEFTYERPKSRKNDYWKITSPDIDKLVRAILDSLTVAGVYGDDAQVASLQVTKVYGVAAGVTVQVAPASTRRD